MKVASRIVIVSILMYVAVACTSIDFNYPREPSCSIRDTNNTALARQY